VNRLVLWVSLLLCAILQAMLPAWGTLGNAKPPLLLGAVLYYALSRGNHQVVEAAVLAGLLQDSLGLIPHGYSVLAFCATALLANHYRDRVFADHWFTHVMLGIGSSTLSTLLLWLMLSGAGLRSELGFHFALSKALGMSLLGLVVFPLVYKAIHHLDLLLGNPVRREA
jgi:rod shape-determining protein MreD